MKNLYKKPKLLLFLFFFCSFFQITAADFIFPTGNVLLMDMATEKLLDFLYQNNDVLIQIDIDENSFFFKAGEPDTEGFAAFDDFLNDLMIIYDKEDDALSFHSFNHGLTLGISLKDQLIMLCFVEPDEQGEILCFDYSQVNPDKENPDFKNAFRSLILYLSSYRHSIRHFKDITPGE